MSENESAVNTNQDEADVNSLELAAKEIGIEVAVREINIIMAKKQQLIDIGEQDSPEVEELLRQAKEKLEAIVDSVHVSGNEMLLEIVLDPSFLDNIKKNREEAKHEMNLIKQEVQKTRQEEMQKIKENPDFYIKKLYESNLKERKTVAEQSLRIRVLEKQNEYLINKLDKIQGLLNN
jgi:hypothetical protein